MRLVKSVNDFSIFSDCNALGSSRNILSKCAASGLRRAACGERPAASGLRRAACGERPAACGLRRAASGLRPAACGLRREFSEFYLTIETALAYFKCKGKRTTKRKGETVMTRKQFVALATNLKIVLAGANTPGERAVATEAIKAVADVCAANNGSFDRERFYKACGL